MKHDLGVEFKNTVEISRINPETQERFKIFSTILIDYWNDGQKVIVDNFERMARDIGTHNILGLIINNSDEESITIDKIKKRFEIDIYSNPTLIITKKHLEDWNARDFLIIIRLDKIQQLKQAKFSEYLKALAIMIRDEEVESIKKKNQWNEFQIGVGKAFGRYKVIRDVLP